MTMTALILPDAIPNTILSLTVLSHMILRNTIVLSVSLLSSVFCNGPLIARSVQPDCRSTSAGSS